MATVDKLVVRIEADMKDLKSKLKSATTATQQSTNKMKASFAKLKTSVGGVGRSIFSLKGALIGLGVGAGLKSLINVGNEVESLQIRFETLFGSAEEGAKAFEIMAKFAGKVPFSLQQIQAGSGSLLAVAGDAEELGELLEMTGTIAAATGLDFRTASEQIQRSLSAGIGAADLFRDRGVTAMLGFKAGTQVSVKETREALEKFAKDNDGITDKLANTFAGTMSMLGDSVFSFQRTVNDAGFFSSLTAHFSDLKTTIDENQVEIAQFAKDLSEGLVGAMNAVKDAVVFVANHFTLLKNVILAIIAAKVIIFFGNVVIALGTLSKALGIAAIAQKGFNIAVLSNPYVRVGMVLVGTIGLVVSAYKLLTENQKELTTAVKESNKALTEEQTLNAEKLAIAQQMNEFYEKNGGRPDGVDEFGGTKAGIKLAKANEKASDITITSIDKLIQAEKDKQAQLSLSAFELAKYNLLQEEGISLTTIQVKEKLALLEVQMSETARLIKEEKALDLVTKQMETHVDAVKKLTDENALLNAELHDATETELLQMAMRQANTGATNDQIKALDLLIAKNQELKDKMTIKEEDEETKTKKEEDEDQAVLDLVDDLGLLKDAQQDYTDAVARLGTALDEDLISLEQYKNGLHQLKITLLESTEEGKIAIEGLERVQDLLFDNLADALTGAEDGWKGFRDGLKSIVRDIISDLLKLQAQQAMTRMMGGGGSGGGGLSSLLSFGASLFGASGGGGGSFAGPSSMGSGGYGQAANGGHINAPTIVGEKGPELFVPHTSGGVFTNRSLKNSGGGGATVNQTINIETGVAQTVRAELQSLMPQIKMETVSAVIDAKKRGGQMANTFS